MQLKQIQLNYVAIASCPTSSIFFLSISSFIYDHVNYTNWHRKPIDKDWNVSRGEVENKTIHMLFHFDSFSKLDFPYHAFIFIGSLMM